MGISSKEISWLIVAGAALAVHILLFSYVGKNPDIMLMPVDSAEYLQAAQNLRNHKTLYTGDLSVAIEPHLFSRRPPLYPLFIAGVQLVWNSKTPIIVAQICLTFFNAALILHFFRKMGIDPRATLILTVSYLFFPSQLIYTYTIMAEILLQTLLLLAAASVFHYFLTKRIRFLLFYNIFICCALLTKPILLYFWLPNALFHLILFLQNRQRQVILLLPLILVGTLFINSYRNERQTGYYHYSSIKNYNLLHCNTYLFLMEMEGRKKADQFVNSILQEVKQREFKEANQTIERRCLSVIKDNWKRYTLFQLRGSLFFFFDPGRFELFHFLNRPQPESSFARLSDTGMKGFLQYFLTIPPPILVALSIIMTANCILFTLVIISVFYPSPFVRTKLFLLFLVAFFIVMTGPFGASRFRLAVIPLLLVHVSTFFIKRRELTGYNQSRTNDLI